MADAQTHVVTAQQEQNRPQGVTRESLVVSPCLTQQSLIVSPCFLLSEEGRKEEKSSIRLAGGGGGGERGCWGEEQTLDLAGGGTKGSWVWNSAGGSSAGFAGLALGLLGFAGLLSALRSEVGSAAGAGKAASLPGTASLIEPATHTWLSYHLDH